MHGCEASGVRHEPLAVCGVRMTEAAADRIRPGERNELEISTTLIRRFLGIANNELVELTAFVNNKGMGRAMQHFRVAHRTTTSGARSPRVQWLVHAHEWPPLRRFVGSL